MKTYGPALQKYLVRFLFAFWMFSLTGVLIFRFVPVFVTPLMGLRLVQGVLANQWVGIRHDWVPLDEISPAVIGAVLKAEDYRFYDHFGFDFEAIKKAYRYNQTHKQKKGASTITQQTAKNVFLWPSRSWLRKGFESYFTVLIELVWPKDRILEVYLNVIELGPGVYGVEAASQKYFRRSAKRLTHAQAALIAAVLPNPQKLRIESPSRYVLNRQRRILNRVAPVVSKSAEASLLDFFDLKFEDEE
ncbi:MAG: monofunctional biosynthetic peptidoglycan transglycosylase [Bdellovibrionaceae bacterium]|nr:monofunctional biosynthetic peptidoglycan transglycosylase [Pseudobdellovibrionaceae bacterium]